MQSLMCFNGVRLNCSGSFTHDKGVKLMVLFLGLGVFLTVTVILHIEKQSVYWTPSTQSGTLAASAYKEPTDLTDDTLSYGIIFDCGSSGSRVYIYFWPPHTGSREDLLSIHQVLDHNSKPMSLKVKPGLSTFNKNSSYAAEYLRPLLNYAAGIIPKHKHKATPLYIMATAGMRLIDQGEAQAILADVVRDVPKWFDFKLAADHVQIISGQTEGMYAWISLNYMLNRFSYTNSKDTSAQVETTDDHVRMETVGVVDMGGGSLQIAFEVDNPSDIKDDEHGITFNLGPDDQDKTYQYTIYVSTFLGYGANSALSRYQRALVSKEGANASVVADDCLAKNSYVDFTAAQGADPVKLRGTGDVQSCMKSLRPLLDADKPCQASPCSIDGKHQPPIPKHAQFYGISEYWYSTYDVLNLNGYYSYRDTTSHAEHFCQTPWTQTMTSYNKGLYPHADMERMITQCFKVSWVMEALHEGLKFPHGFKTFRPVNEIDGQEVQWSLGALLHKTRHLRDVSLTGVRSFDGLRLTGLSSAAPYILAACIAVVLLAILLYCSHLQRMKVVPGLRNVPSMSYFMTNADEAEQGLIQEKHYYP